MPMMRTVNPMQPFRMGLLLAVCSGILIGVSYPPFRFAYGAAIALIPWLIAGERDEVGFRRWFTLTFLMLVVAGLIELYWAGGAFGSPLRHRRDFYFLGLGLLTLVTNPLSLLATLSVWKVVSRYLRSSAGLLLLPVFWVAGERLQTMVDLFIPWTPIGNSFSTALVPAQIASIGGVAILSFWAVVLNVLLYAVAVSFVEHRDSGAARRRSLLIAAWLIVFLIPHLYGWMMPEPEPSGNRKIRVAVIQPNVNAYEKWHGHGNEEVAHLMALTRNAARSDTPDCILWPESAIPLFIFDTGNDSLLHALHALTDSLGTVIVTGYDDKQYFRPGEPLSINRKYAPDGRAYQIHNGAMVLMPHTDQVEKYWKIILVPFTESIPFSKYLPVVDLDFLRLNLGFDDCAAGIDTTVFRVRTRGGDTVRFSVLVCYESAFPEFTSCFAGNGAEFLSVVTNDSWWGNTSGPYQHEQFAVLRAIENRRWIVQCANGGISAFIDPLGNTAASTSMFNEEILKCSMDIRNKQETTYFTAHGDWLGRGCLWAGLALGVLAAATAAGGRLKKKGNLT
jgi:apolipoprotein N-acyltransferase